MNINTKSTKAHLLTVAKDQAQKSCRLQKELRILFIISGLLLISHFL